MKTPKYTTIFSSKVKPIVSKEKDELLAVASLEKLKSFFPDVDLEKNGDLLPIAFNACVANRVNKNGDVVSTASAVAFHKSFINKPINVEHNRQSVIGFITTAGFTEFGTDKPLTEEEVKEKTGPFNVALGGLVWRIASEDVASAIEESGDPSSEYYLQVSASWELGFEDYNLVILPEESKNLSEASVVNDKEEVVKLTPILKSLGGAGKLEDGRAVFRQPIGDITPLGIGLTETPAAEVVGVSTPGAKDSDETLEDAVANKVVETIAYEAGKGGLIGGQVSETLSDASASEGGVKSNNNKDISQKQNNTVKQNSIIMKINSLKDITDESLKEVSASAITRFLADELAQESEKFVEQKGHIEKDLKASNEKVSELEKQLETANTEMEEVKTSLKEIQNKEEARAAQELFDSRMASFDEKYDLDDDTRKVFASQIKDLDEEAFSVYEQNAVVLMKGREKSTETKTTETTASSTDNTETVVDDAIDNSESEPTNVPTTTTASEPTLKDRMKSAFSMDNMTIK